MKRLTLVMLSALLACTGAFAYDTDLAQSYERLFAPAAGKAVSKSLQMMTTEDFVKAQQAGEDILVLDVRTPGETRILGVTIPNTLVIPLDQVFKAENLQRLPTEGKIVVLCKGGHRAVAVATGLRHIGFDNAYVLKLGLMDLAKYLSPKTAY